MRNQFNRQARYGTSVAYNFAYRTSTYYGVVYLSGDHSVPLTACREYRTCYPAVRQSQRFDGGALGLPDTGDRLPGERDVARLVAAEQHLDIEQTSAGQYSRRAGRAAP